MEDEPRPLKTVSLNEPEEATKELSERGCSTASVLKKNGLKENSTNSPMREVEHPAWGAEVSLRRLGQQRFAVVIFQTEEPQLVEASLIRQGYDVAADPLRLRNGGVLFHAAFNSLDIFQLDRPIGLDDVGRLEDSALPWHVRQVLKAVKVSIRLKPAIVWELTYSSQSSLSPSALKRGLE